MSDLKLLLLGPSYLERSGNPVKIQTRKAFALLVYLAVTHQSHSRDSLATLLWPENNQSQARTYLRRALWILKSAVGEDVFLIDQQNLGINQGAKLWVDVDHFHHLIKSCEKHSHANNEVCQDCLLSLAEAVNMHRGAFLAGFTLSDSPEFDDWQFFQSDSLEQELMQTLENLVLAYSAIGDYEAAIPFAQRWVSLDPLREPVQRVLMQLYSQAGQISAALRQYNLCVGLLDDELGLTPEQETIELFEQIKARRKLGLSGKKDSKLMVKNHQGDSFHRVDSKPKPAINLPAQLTPFIGREKELAEISQLILNEPECRLLTLIGPGGIGKTRLALEAAAQIGKVFNDGANFVSLASVSEVTYIVPAIADALKLNFQGDRDPKTQLLHHLSRRNYLLILDNFEHLLTIPPHTLMKSEFDAKEKGMIGGEALLSEILGAGLDNKILVTSRERLNIQEEWGYEVQGMPFPESASTLEVALENLDEYAAVDLFLQRARKADTHFACSAEDISSVIRICQLVGGMPLGIELAAPWIRLMPCDEIANEIQKNFDLLTTSLRNVPERHRSMRAIFEQTWQRLSTKEQTLLTKLSIFRGGCLRDAAEFVAGANLPLLSSLVDKALLHQTSTGRYALHELIRQFAQEQLLRTPKTYTQTLNKHYRYYTIFLQQNVEGLKGGAQLKTAKVITDDIDNVRFAWRRAVEAKDIDALERASEGLYLYSELVGALSEGEDAFRQALTAFGPNVENAICEENSLKGFMLAAQGALCAHRGDLTAGQALLEQGLEFLNSDGDENQQLHKKAYALMWLGWVFFLQAKNARVENIIQESLTLCNRIRDRWGVARNLYILGNSLTGSGRLAEAELPLRQSLEICQEIGDRRSRLFIDWNLAILTFWFGDYLQTEHYLTDAVMLGKGLDDQIGLALALKEWGKLEVALGKYDQAAHTIKESIAITDEIGSHWESAATLDDLGFALCLKGDYIAAEKALKQCLIASQERQHRYFIARCFGNLGLLASLKQQYQQAEEFMQKALKIWTDLGHEPYRAWILCQLGHLLQISDQNRSLEAREYYIQSLQQSIKHKLAPFAMDVFYGLAGLMTKMDPIQNAVNLLVLAGSHPASTFDTKQKAINLLSELNTGLSIEPNRTAAGYQSLKWEKIAAEFTD